MAKMKSKLDAKPTRNSTTLSVWSRSPTQPVNEVRSEFGFSRTDVILDDAINSAVDSLLSQGKLGEASVGLRLRL